MRVPDLGSLLSEVQARRMALDATGSYFVNDIDAPHAEDFAKSILLMSIPRRGQRDQPITVYINSGGGSVGDGLAMMEMISRMRPASTSGSTPSCWATRTRWAPS